MNVPAKTETDLYYGLWTREQINLIKNLCAKGASDDEFALLCYQAKRTGLDPLSKQIYLIPRWDASVNRIVRSPGVSIDGLRVIADRSGKYAGQTAPLWADASGKWHDVWLHEMPPSAAKVSVLRKDFELAVPGVARFSSYVQVNKEGKPNRAWTEMPDIMIAKCAEALALRKAFPQDMSGIYTDDEFPETSQPQPLPNAQVATAAAPTPPQENDGAAATTEEPGDQETRELLMRSATEGTSALKKRWQAIMQDKQTTHELREWVRTKCEPIAREVDKKTFK